MTRPTSHYAITSLPAGGGLSPEDSLAVFSFSSRSLRDAWVSYEWGDATTLEEERLYGHRALLTHGEERRSATRNQALSALRVFYPGIRAADMASMLRRDDTLGRG